MGRGVQTEITMNSLKRHYRSLCNSNDGPTWNRDRGVIIILFSDKYTTHKLAKIIQFEARDFQLLNMGHYNQVSSTPCYTFTTTLILLATAAYLHIEYVIATY